MICSKQQLLCLLLVIVALPANPASATERVLDSQGHHLRFGEQREWSEFPEDAEAAELNLNFTATGAAQETTLRLKHRDVKQAWSLELNGRVLGRLPVDENEMVTFWSIPANTLQDGDNRLRIYGSGKLSDDVVIGDVRLDDRPRQQVLSETKLTVLVRDADSQQPVPSRITILDAEGALMTTGASSSDTLAVRPGIVYTADGRATIPLRSGRYTVYAGRGFEYSVAKSEVALRAGADQTIELSIRREVSTPGYVACDTHCHTFTYSRHGDATIDERMVTLAGEGIELPVATDHNVQVDYDGPAKRLGVRQHFTPIVGNEVTTDFGHFNTFPLVPGPASIDHSGQDWPTIFKAIHGDAPDRMVVLNHARDIHKGYRPFDPKHHIGIAGERLDGWPLRVNLMEVVNSGTTQTDGLQLFHDWFGLLNRGFRIAPVGTSDSHDVGRHFVGHGRTYVKCDDRDPGAIPLEQVYDSLRAGRVLISYGLLADLRIGSNHGPGDLVPTSGPLDVTVRVLGPHWTKSRQVTLYANGIPIREVDIASDAGSSKPGVKWQDEWRLETPKHDVFLAVIATGPGVRELFWPTPKPYQPASPDWTSYVVGASGAIFIDADGDGKFTPAQEYAERLIKKADGDLAALLLSLEQYDEAVAIQTASVLAGGGQSLFDDGLTRPLRDAAPHVRRGFQRFTEAWRYARQSRQGL